MNLTKNIFEKLRGMEEHLSANVLGQMNAVRTLVSHCQRAELNLTAKEQPKGCFLFLGQPGVGKTELAIVFSEYLAGKGNFARFDMADFMRPDTVKEFRGESGTDRGKGRLGETLERFKTGGTLLFDEVEKGHPDLMKLFLGILSNAQVTVADGTVYDMSNYYCIFTSNIGSKQLKATGSLSDSQIKGFIHAEVQKHFSPEWYDRMDEVVIFKGLKHEVQRAIVELHLNKKIGKLQEVSGHDISYTDVVLEYIIREGITEQTGARPLKKCIARNVEGALAAYMLQHEQNRLNGQLNIKDNQVVFQNVENC